MSRWWARLRRAARSERGSVGGVEVLPFAVLVFVCGGLLLVNTWAVVDAKLAVAAAAREAARTHVEGGDGTAARAAAERAGREAFAADGRSPAGLDLRGPAGPLARCGTVTYTAHTEVAAIAIPWIGGFGHGIDVTARHTTRVDRLRAGVAEEVAC